MDGVLRWREYCRDFHIYCELVSLLHLQTWAITFWQMIKCRATTFGTSQHFFVSCLTLSFGFVDLICFRFGIERSLCFWFGVFWMQFETCSVFVYHFTWFARRCFNWNFVKYGRHWSQLCWNNHGNCQHCRHDPRIHFSGHCWVLNFWESKHFGVAAYFWDLRGDANSLRFDLHLAERHIDSRMEQHPKTSRISKRTHAAVQHKNH